MIVCQCNVFRSAEVKQAIDSARGRDGLGLATPGAIFKQMGCRPNCGKCMANLHRLIFEEAAKERCRAEERTLD